MIGDIIMYDLKGASKNNNELNPQVIITITWSNFFKSWTTIAINVRGTANFYPISSGTNEPRTIPAKVDNCQKIQRVPPEPSKW